jgi:hypothetical protein
MVCVLGGGFEVQGGVAVVALLERLSERCQAMLDRRDTSMFVLGIYSHIHSH